MSIELLAPARDLECAIAAIDHGADAVYIGAEQFGARASAGNSDEDIAEVVRYARPFGVKVYVTLNTLLDGKDELLRARDLAWRMYNIGVDALIVQDPRLARLPNFPPIPLHASTQMDNHTAEKVRDLCRQSYEQVVLARELTLDEIADIHRQVPEAVLEVFIHGAVCVSYNGRCYASEVCYGRSANRGECAQFCRMPYDLEDDAGHKLATGRYLLSMRDMNRTAQLEALLDAGARSLKIEGRLKDAAYVKNVVAWYRQHLDAIFRRRSEYCRASWGRVEINFEPNPARTFNRLFTDYFMSGRTTDLANTLTPKSMGERVGFVKEIRRGYIVVAGTASFANGDGFCFIAEDAGQPRLVGFRINRAEGNHLYPHRMPPGLRDGMIIYRNQDQTMETILAGATARRTLPLRWTLEETPEGFRLSVQIMDNGEPMEQREQTSLLDLPSRDRGRRSQWMEQREQTSLLDLPSRDRGRRSQWIMENRGGRASSLTFKYDHQPARTDQSASIRDILSRLGDTIYETTDVQVHFSSPWFIPRSVLTTWRREVLESLNVETHGSASPSNVAYPQGDALPGVSTFNPVSPHSPLTEPPLMTCRYCIRYQLGQCLRDNPSAVRGNLYLRGADGRRFRLNFNCRTCHMIVEQA